MIFRLELNPETNGITFERYLRFIQEKGEGEKIHDPNDKIESLDLNVRLFNNLKHAGINTVGEILDLLTKGGKSKLLVIRDIGSISADQILLSLMVKSYITQKQFQDLKDGKVLNREG